MKILIGDISSYKAIVIAKQVKKLYSEIEVYGYDYRPILKNIHTKYCDYYVEVQSPQRLKEHIEGISNIINANSIDFFFPVHSNLYGEYIKHKDMFGSAFSYISNYDSYINLHDKAKLQKLCCELKVRVPKSYKHIKSAEIPFVIKPTNQSSSKGVFYIKTEEKKQQIKIGENNKIIQEYITGSGCGYSVFAEEGVIKKSHGHIRVAESPVKGGSSVYRADFEHPEMKSIAEKILKHVQWSGFAMFEFKLTHQNEIVLIEVNPRIWGSINQGLVNGTNYFESILGAADSSLSGVYYTYLSPLIYKSFAGYLISGNVKPLVKFFKNIKHNRSDVSPFDDLLGYMSMIFRKL